MKLSPRLEIGFDIIGTKNIEPLFKNCIVQTLMGAPECERQQRENNFFWLSICSDNMN